MPPTGFEPVSRAREARMINRTTLQGHGPDRIRTGVWWSEATQDIQTTSQAQLKNGKNPLKNLWFYPIWSSREGNGISYVVYPS